MMESDIINVPGYTLGKGWSPSRMFSLKFKNGFFTEHFIILVLTIWQDQFFVTRHNAFLEVFAFDFCVGVYFSMRICMKNL